MNCRTRFAPVDALDVRRAANISLQAPDFGTESVSAGAIKMTEIAQSHEGTLVGMPWPEEARVTARLSPTPGVRVVDGSGADMWKTRAMVERLLRLDGSNVGLSLTVSLPVPLFVESGAAKSHSFVDYVSPIEYELKERAASVAA